MILRTKTVISIASLSALLLLLQGCLGGCANESGKNTTVGRTTETVQPVSPVMQHDYQRGAQLTWNIYNAPARGVVTPASADNGNIMPSPFSGGVPQSQPAAALRIGPDGIKEALASYQQSGFTFTVTLGDTSGQATQNPQLTTTGTTTSNQNPSTSGKVEPRSNVTASLAAGMPGSAVNSSATGTGVFDSPGSNPQNTSTTSPTQSPLYSQVTAPANAMGQVLQALGSYLQALAGVRSPALPVGVPASQPAATSQPTN